MKFIELENNGNWRNQKTNLVLYIKGKLFLTFCCILCEKENKSNICFSLFIFPWTNATNARGLLLPVDTSLYECACQYFAPENASGIYNFKKMNVLFPTHKPKFLVENPLVGNIFYNPFPCSCYDADLSIVWSSVNILAKLHNKRYQNSFNIGHFWLLFFLCVFFVNAFPITTPAGPKIKQTMLPNYLEKNLGIIFPKINF